jgi:hypothetical protein
MIICDSPQGSPEWHAERAGCITASMYQTIMDKLKSGKEKGGYKKAALDYAFRLAVERISGEPLDEGFETWAMRRGNELEPQARAAHAFQRDLDIDPCGFIKTEDGIFGASADGLIGKDGGAEYKCLIDPARIRSIIIERDISEFLPQVQGGMWITGRKWWHFCLYCPALGSIGKALTVFEVERDDDYVEALELELVEFNRLVEQYMAAIISGEVRAAA